MVKISGIRESLVKKPIANRIAQKNSAKIANCNETAGPSPIGSLNVVRLLLKLAILDHPWVIIISAEPILRSARPMAGINWEVEKNIFFIKG